MLHEGNSIAIQRFQSRGQHLCRFFGAKESVYKGKSSTPTGYGLEDQRGRNFIVKTLCIVVPVRQVIHMYKSRTFLNS